MKKTLKRTLATFLTVIMLFSALPLAGINLKANALASTGKCGDNVSWSFNSSTGTLTISGTGKMYDYNDAHSPFYYNSLIKSVIIKNGVTSIGNTTFYSCEGLIRVTIPDSVTSIGYDAFCNCTNLTSITIPDSVTSIGSDAFFVTGYYNESSNWKNEILYIGNHLIGADKSLSGSYSIKQGTKTIAGSAFSYCKGLTKITVPNSVTSIGDEAFFECISLTNLIIPESIISIGDYAFEYCNSLRSISVDKNNPVYDSRNNCNAIIETATNTIIKGCNNTIIPESVTGIANYSFEECFDLTNIIIPDSIINIGDAAFARCYSLTSITIPNILKNIGNWVFSGCTGLTSITIPDSVMSIGWGAFEYCTNLTDVYYSGTKEQWKKIDIGVYNECLTNATIHYNSTGNAPDDPTPDDPTIVIPDPPSLIDCISGTFDSYVIATDYTGKAWISSVKINGISYDVKENLLPFKSTSEYDQYIGKKVVAEVNKKEIMKMQFISDYQSEEANFVDEHIKVYNRYRGSWTESGFDHSANHSAINKNAVLARILDSIKDAGEVATFQFKDLQVTADYYDTYLSDMMLAFSKKSAVEELKFNVDKIFTDRVDDLKKFLDSGKTKLPRNFDIESAFRSNYEISKETKKVFSKVFKEAYSNNPNLFEGIFRGLDCAGEFYNDIITGYDAYSTLRQTYQAYCVSMATKEIYSEFYDFCYDAADELAKTNSKYAGWFRKNIDKFKKNAFSDKDLYLRSKTLCAGGFLILDTVGEEFLINCSCNIIANVLKVGAGEVLAVITAWNAGVALGELISPTDTDSAYYMLYISPVEGAMQTVLDRYANSMKQSKTFDAALKYEIAFTTLKYTNVALYEKCFEYCSKSRFLWIKTKSSKQNAEEATSWKELWQTFKCHFNEYSEELNTNRKAIGVHCPVDVYLYNRNNELVLSIVNEKVGVYNDEKVAFDICNEQKGISYPEDGDYRIKIVSRSSGTMDYSVLSFNGDKFREIETNNIPLTAKQEFIGTIPQDHNAETKEFELTTKGQTIETDFDSYQTVKSVSINDLEVFYKNNAKLTPIVSIGDGEKYTVKYESSNPSVATVDKNGNISTVHKGSTTITCTVTDEYGNTVKDTCTVTVKFQWWQWLIWILLFGFLWY